MVYPLGEELKLQPRVLNKTIEDFDQQPRLRRSAGGYALWKPSIEFVIAVVTLPIWGTLIAILWLAVKATDIRSPAFFKQKRTGLGGRPFALFKLRTMIPSAPAMQESLRAHNLTKDSVFDFKMADDPRVTRLGRLLRSTHLDELPQLFNVLRGEMSIVGPRPSSVPAAEHKAAWLPRLSVRPGLTGLAQIYRAETPNFESRVQLDLDYIQNQSVWLDIWIVWRTFKVALIERKGL